MTDGLNEGEKRAFPIDILREAMGDAVRSHAVVMLSRTDCEGIMTELEQLERYRAAFKDAEKTSYAAIYTPGLLIEPETKQTEVEHSGVVSLAEVRNAREKPDAEFRTTDQWGKEMGMFMLDYTFPTIEKPSGATFSVHMWAYDWADAEARLAAVKLNGHIEGQLFTTTRR